MMAGVDAPVAAAQDRESDAALRARIAELVPEDTALGTSHEGKRHELALVA